jgi:Translation initiation factor eIF3 subunit 135
VIPAFGLRLDQDPVLRARVFSSTEHMVQMIHLQGINVRWIGYLRSFTSTPDVRARLLEECVARSVKHIIRQQHRYVRSHFLCVCVCVWCVCM